MNRWTLAAPLFIALAIALSPACSATTHLMQTTTADHVVLVDQSLPGGSSICGTLSFQDRAFFRVFPDGTMSTKPFVVPKKSSLVMTDVEWAAYGGPLGTNPLAQGNTLRLRIFLVTPTSAARVFTSRGITLDTDTTTGRPGASEQFTAGFVVGPGVFICPSAAQVTPSSVATEYIDYIILRGYIAP